MGHESSLHAQHSCYTHITIESFRLCTLVGHAECTAGVSASGGHTLRAPTKVLQSCDLAEALFEQLRLARGGKCLPLVLQY